MLGTKEANTYYVYSCTLFYVSVEGLTLMRDLEFNI